MVGLPVRVVSQASSEALELPSLLALYAELAATDLGRRRLLALEPSSELEEIHHRHRLLGDTGNLLEEGSLVPSREEPLSTLLESLHGGDPAVSGPQLMQLASVLEVTRRLTERVRSSEVEVAQLRSLVDLLPDGEPLRRRIIKSLDKRGRVRDDASPALARLRRTVHRIRDGLYKQLQETLTDHQEHFSESTVSLKDGRLTLLLKAGARGRLDGLVHGRSGTGQSLYFEPLAVVDSNNSLQETIEEEEAERHRILMELVAEALQELPLIEAHFAALAEVDLLQTVCSFAELSDSHLPEITQQGELRMLAARHPLLDPSLSSLRESALGQAGHLSTVVPLDLELDSAKRVLVVTGPNAGGKTVALKTVGLLALAAQCGLPIPARAGTRIPVFKAIMAMVGDEQDLLADKSTFSARLLRLKEAWDIAGPQTLVLLDELGSGTDPEEGSALAVALLEGLLQSDTMAILTTHLTQLAAVALERQGAACAAMEFDPDSGEPTYNLRPGAPGGSEALALAQRLGLPRPWLERAEALLGDEHRDLRGLLAEVEGVRQQLAITQSRAQTEERDLQRKNQNLDAKLAAVESERQNLGQKLRQEVEEFRRQVTRQIQQEVEGLRREVELGRKKGLTAAAVGRLFEETPELVAVEEASGEPVEIGKAVEHRSLGWRGKLERVRGKTAQVAVRGKRIQCALEELVTVRENAQDAPRRRPLVELHGRGEVGDDFPSELNLVGSRVEPALDRLDRFLDRALLSSRQQIRVVHGFGSGRLRGAVREHLRTHPAVAEYRSGQRDEGGDGATIVTLDKA